MKNLINKKYSWAYFKNPLETDMERTNAFDWIMMNSFNNLNKELKKIDRVLKNITILEIK